MAKSKSTSSEKQNVATKSTNDQNKILLITNDYVFKRIFSLKETLVPFLSDYFDYKFKDEEVEIENPILGPIVVEDKVSIPDLKITIKIDSEVFG
ncbi:MAG: hypothetical protein IJU40_03765, partial [Desulfovibrionaceae bacterium]|nr:hypothetical protein [Desulfovibrionaceae bacterium]